eukprot:6904519-Pyramimonas_sp.AAC.1
MGLLRRECAYSRSPGCRRAVPARADRCLLLRSQRPLVLAGAGDQTGAPFIWIDFRPGHGPDPQGDAL